MAFSIEIKLHRNILVENENNQYIQRTTYNLSRDEAASIYDIIGRLDVIKKGLINYFGLCNHFDGEVNIYGNSNK